MKIEIKSIVGTLLFEGDFSSIAEAVGAAIKAKTNLRSANLSYAKNAKLAIAMTRILPEGAIIGWKKCKAGAIVRLLIPEDAKRSHAFGRKCRASHAVVIDVFDCEGKRISCATSGRGLTYRTGEAVVPDKWCEDWTNECSNGVHFFITREEAEAYSV